MNWLRVTKWKVATIVVIVLVALVVDGYAYIARVTATRTAEVAKAPPELRIRTYQKIVKEDSLAYEQY